MNDTVFSSPTSSNKKKQVSTSFRTSFSVGNVQAMSFRAERSVAKNLGDTHFMLRRFFGHSPQQHVVLPSVVRMTLMGNFLKIHYLIWLFQLESVGA